MAFWRSRPCCWHLSRRLLCTPFSVLQRLGRGSGPSYCFWETRWLRQDEKVWNKQIITGKVGRITLCYQHIKMHSAGCKCRMSNLTLGVIIKTLVSRIWSAWYSNLFVWGPKVRPVHEKWPYFFSLWENEESSQNRQGLKRLGIVSSLK